MIFTKRWRKKLQCETYAFKRITHRTGKRREANECYRERFLYDIMQSNSKIPKKTAFGTLPVPLLWVMRFILFKVWKVRQRRKKAV